VTRTSSDLLLLDEPTTYLDLSHQIDVPELVGRLHAERGRTVVAVLHDLNLAARYAQRLVAMKDGALVASGTPEDVLTERCWPTSSTARRGSCRTRSRGHRWSRRCVACADA
jgi:ABC-type cobalamin/Fe3+-siderophores transport system ATPase subunit